MTGDDTFVLVFALSVGFRTKLPVHLLLKFIDSSEKKKAKMMATFQGSRARTNNASKANQALTDSIMMTPVSCSLDGLLHRVSR